MSMSVNGFDRHILAFNAQLPNQFPHLALVARALQVNNLLCGGLLACILWYFWLRTDDPAREFQRRQRLLLGLAALAVAVLFARLLAELLPFSPRPIAVPELRLLNPQWAVDIPIESWSAFPSEHAALWFSLATIILFLNVRLGLLAFAYVAFLSFCRIYLGLHFPTDILMGAAIGVTTVTIANRSPRLASLASWMLEWGKRHEFVFISALFLFVYQVANMFGDVRAVARLFVHTS